MPRLVEPLAADPGGRPELVVGLGLVAVTAATPWLPRIVGAVPLSIAIGALAAFALGGAIVGTLLPQLAAAVARPEPELVATAASAGAAVVTGLVVIGFLHGSPRGRIARCRRDRRALADARRHRWLARLPAPLSPRAPDRPPRLPARRLARPAVMTASVGTEMALLVDVGSAWVKASVVGRARGRWRIVAHASQPTSWGAAELRRQLVEQLEATGDPRLAGRYEDLLSTANRIECHTARQVGRLAVVAVSREISGGAARRAAEAAGWEVADVVTLDDGRSLAERLALLQAIEVDAWLLAGSFDDASSPRALEAAGLVAAARRVDGGPVVWAGSARLADPVRALFEPGAVTAVGNAQADAASRGRRRSPGSSPGPAPRYRRAGGPGASLLGDAAAGRLGDRRRRRPPRPRGRPGSPWRDPGAGGAGRLGRVPAALLRRPGRHRARGRRCGPRRTAGAGGGR